MNYEVEKITSPENILYRGRPLMVYSKIELLEIIVELQDELIDAKKKYLRILECLV